MSNTSQVIFESAQLEAQEDERSELEAVAAALRNSSRLLRLITYIGEKYFSGETEKLREYDIATEVFGRSKTTFDAGEDAIVRVEAHRLRKRLKEYYGNEGKSHPIQLSIPLGAYVPVFTRCSVAAETPDSEVAAPRRGPTRHLIAAAVVLILVAGALYLAFHGSHAREKRAAGAASPAATSAGSSATSNFATIPLRILAGYTGKPQIDGAGDAWQPDEYFHYGGNWHISANFIARTNDPMLFEHMRNGTFSYDIPLHPGAYELHLYFMAMNREASQPATFSVSANGEPILSNLDVSADTMGPYVADERVFRDISPAADGILHLYFTGGSAAAALNALEILPGLPHRQLPIRLVMQPRSFTDHSSQLWRPDNYYLGGYTSTSDAVVTGTSDPDLYTNERYGHFSYYIPVDTRDRYTLILHFAELYFGPNAPGGGGAGSRVFRVLCNGNTLLDNFDIYKEVGSLHALTKTFYHLKPTAEGELNIIFEPIVNNATVSSIEVVDESQ